jgi:DinB superfamily
VSELADIPPDSRDWTFVITEGCEECGFTPQPPETTGARLRATIAFWLDALAGEGSRERPAPAVWSTLEYGCHIRDACQTFRQRLKRMLAEDDPLFANWDQDATAIAEQYDHQDPTEVGQELAAEVIAIAAAFDAVEPDEWDRPGRRSNGSNFSVATLAVYFLHDIEHHLHDIGPSARVV